MNISYDTQALALLQELFPSVDAHATLNSVTAKMDTFIAIGHQYKTDIEVGGSRYKDVLLFAMAEILNELRPYEMLLMHLYPHMVPFFKSLQKWYTDYLMYGDVFA